MTNTAAVEARGVAIGYDGRLVVEGLDLVVPTGETVALLGPSGSGKSTILAALAGFIPIRAGEIRIDGQVVATTGRHQPPERRNVGVVFQAAALWPHMSALETVAFPIRRRGVSATDARGQALGILERLAIAPLAARRPAEMSGGEQQRVGLGRALARGAGTYLFDEPTAHLDADLRERLQAEIAEHRREAGAAAIYATHDTAEALAIADRVLLLRGGRIIQQGAPAEVYERPIDLWSARLTGPAAVVRLHLVDTVDATASVLIDGALHAVQVASSHSVPLGEVDAVVRPDWLRLDGPSAGRIERVSFRGTHTDYVLATSIGEIGIRAAGPPTVGRGASVGWSIDRAWLLPESADHRRSADRGL